MEMSATVGAAVRAHRKERGWSLDRAATRLGVSRRLLTQIESGSANPSLSTLLSIANGFGIDLTSLIAKTPGAVDAVLQPDNGSAALLWSTDAGSAARLVVGMGPLEMWVWRLEPGESKRSDAHSAGSLEALIVNAGRVEVDIEGGESHTVDAGQSLIFAADVDHGYRSVADGAAEFHLAVFDPIDNPAGR
ncbi:MAG: helix-turn-helix domain-containing protein [Ilumatobacter sp.]|uniref:helix-turn-helix domain-containing protein n=2 Tax=Ilumatobacter sp. TaxID=1967498 RepID=UPI00329A4581